MAKRRTCTLLIRLLYVLTLLNINRLLKYLLGIPLLVFFIYNAVYKVHWEVTIHPAAFNTTQVVKIVHTEPVEHSVLWLNNVASVIINKDVKLKILQSFMMHSNKSGLNLVLISTDILKSFIQNPRTVDQECSDWCHGSNVVSFAVLSNNINKEFLYKTIINRGFTITTSYIINPSYYMSTNQFLPSHFFLYHKSSGLLLHLVVFYTRGDNYLWNDRVVVKADANPQWLNNQELEYGKFAMALDSLHATAKTLDSIPTLIPKNISKFLVEVKYSSFFECNHTQAELYHLRYPLSQNKVDNVFRNTSIELFSRLKLALNKIDVKFRLSSGSLLGWYRQCGVIAYTYDMDVEIEYLDYKTEIANTLVENGFTFEAQFGKPWDSLEMRFCYKDVCVDLFFVYKDQPEYDWISVVNGWSGQKYKVVLPKSDHCWSELSGIKLGIPCEFHSYILTMYGAKWFIPKTKWNLDVDQTNMFPNGVWTKREFDFVILRAIPYRKEYLICYSLFFLCICLLMYIYN